MSRPAGMSWSRYWFTPRPGAVYSIRARSLRTGRSVRRAYIGQTRRAVTERVGEHQYGSRRFGKAPQPWAECIEGHETMWSSPRCRQARLNWEEFWRISLYFPVYNITFNRWRPNWRRVTPLEVLKMKGNGHGQERGNSSIPRGGSRHPGRLPASPAGVGAREDRPTGPAVGHGRRGDPAGSSRRR